MGSIVLITDGVGAIKGQMAFGEWGKRVSYNDWVADQSSTYAALQVSTLFTTQGYIGHDMLDAVGLIHMQGRIYDAKIARFVQADPVLQDALDLQAYNRYAYVQNNPLTRIDPYGYASYPDDPRGSFCYGLCFDVSGGYSGGGKGRFAVNVSYAQAIDSNFSIANTGRLLASGSFTIDSNSFMRGILDPHYDSTAALRDELANNLYAMVLIAEAGTGSATTGYKFENGASSDAYAQASEANPYRDLSVNSAIAVMEVTAPRLYLIDRKLVAQLGVQSFHEYASIFWEINSYNPFGPGIETIAVKGISYGLKSVVFGIRRANSVARSVGAGAENVNAGTALNRKLSALEGAQSNAARVRELPDGRVRYYEAERAATNPGPSRGSSYVTEHNPATGNVRSWNETYDHAGDVNRVHPKMINGQSVNSHHYPPTARELGL